MWRLKQLPHEIHRGAGAALVWKGEPLPNGRDTIAAGATFTVRLRWSDFWVKEDGRWQTVGGHRDKVCLLADDLFKEPDAICED